MITNKKFLQWSDKNDYLAIPLIAVNIITLPSFPPFFLLLIRKIVLSFISLYIYWIITMLDNFASVYWCAFDVCVVHLLLQQKFKTNIAGYHNFYKDNLKTELLLYWRNCTHIIEVPTEVPGVVGIIFPPIYRTSRACPSVQVPPSALQNPWIERFKGFLFLLPLLLVNI